VIKYLLFLLLPFAQFANAQTASDSVVQLYGVVMTADSLQALSNVTIMVVDQNRGTLTNEKGIFSLVVLKGDKIEFTSVGFRSRTVEIPKNLVGDQQSLIQLMVTDTFFQPAVIIKPRPTKEQFARDFVNAKVNDDEIEQARKNNDDVKKRVLLETLPADSREAVSFALAQNARKYYYSGQAPPQNIFSPVAWGQFIKAWKRGDFKRKKNR
jgi:CarboxypepD_reg-like domain